jgi:ribosomal protein L12E/L44/L45/RPP1/RPP2
MLPGDDQSVGFWLNSSLEEVEGSVEGAWPVVTAALSPPAVPRAPAITHGEDKEAKNRTDETEREKKEKRREKTTRVTVSLGLKPIMPI